jgi:hypothetical protein
MPKTAGELARSRIDAERTLTARCDIVRPAGGLTDDGYPATGETFVARDVPCRLGRGMMPPWERVVGGQLRATETYALFLPADTALGSPDVIAIGTRRFEVVGQTGAATEDVLKTVDVAELS